MTRPTLYVLAGADGAGKSVLFRDVLALRLSVPFLNPEAVSRSDVDELGLERPQKPAMVADARRQEYLRRGQSFATESSFSHRSKVELVRQAKADGWRVVLYHVSVQTPELAARRVASALGEGGLRVAPAVIAERYARSGELIHEAALLADYAFVYDNSRIGKPPALALAMRDGRVFQRAEQLPEWVATRYAAQLAAPVARQPDAGIESFAQARGLARSLQGEGAVLSIPATRKGFAYTGPIVGDSGAHYVQRVGSNRFVAHLKSSFERPLSLHRPHSVTYAGGGVAIAEQLRMSVPDDARAVDQATVLAKHLMGDRALVSNSVRTGTFSGKIIGETDTHLIQRISGRLAIVHDKANLPAGLQVGQQGILRYTAGKAAFTAAPTLEQGRGLSR